jgi:hypothetical protein
MKKALFAGLIFMAVIFSAHGLGLYFDGGIGIGPAWTTMDGNDFVETITKSGTLDEIAVDLGLKLGLGPFDTIPIHVVGVFGGIGHRISASNNDYYQMNAYLIGPGVVFYPMPSFQIAASLGYSFVGNESSFAAQNNIAKDTSKSGFAWDISAAFDLGAGNHGLLGGLRYFGATNTLKDSGLVQNSSMLSIFIRYAFRHKR